MFRGVGQVGEHQDQHWVEPNEGLETRKLRLFLCKPPDLAPERQRLVTAGHFLDRLRTGPLLLLVTALTLMAVSCSTGRELEFSTDPIVSTILPEGSVSTTTLGSTSEAESPPKSGEEAPSTTAARPTQLRDFFTTLSPGSVLPDGQACADEVRTEPSAEAIVDNALANETVVDLSVEIDGADAYWNNILAPRVDGNFTGTTEQILRWASCKWGFNENITRARAVTESSWRMATEGDRTDDPSLCERIGLAAPCAQSYGLLQVKGTVHEGTFPATTQSTAFGVDYAMAWLRACYEGSFTWLASAGYASGDEWGCVGAWFSGEWLDQSARRYVEEVRNHLDRQAWNDYG